MLSSLMFINEPHKDINLVFRSDMEKASPSESAQDYELAQWLWLVSQRWTKADEHRAALAKPLARASAA